MLISICRQLSGLAEITSTVGRQVDTTNHKTTSPECPLTICIRVSFTVLDPSINYTNISVVHDQIRSDQTQPNALRLQVDYYVSISPTDPFGVLTRRNAFQF